MGLIPSNEQFYKALHEKNAVQRFVSRKAFKALQAMGFHVVGDHFYEPIPNTGLIDRTYSDAQRPCYGIDLRLAPAQELAIQMLQPVAKDFAPDLRRFNFQHDNYYYSGFDALHLYGFVRHFKPPKIIEIGQGASTRVSAAAMFGNRRAGTQNQKLISIDPYVRVERDAAFDGLDVRLEQEVLEKRIDFVLENISAGDLLFIDSSHVFKFGSDVEVLFEEVLPRLAVGAYVHLHDIFTPFQYPKDWLTRQKRFWNEQYILENFLRFNGSFKVLLPTHYLARCAPELREFVEAAIRPDLPAFTPTGSSFYIQRVA